MRACPVCGNNDLSFDGSGYLADGCEGQPDTPLVCDGPTERGGNGCGWRGTEQEAVDAWRFMEAQRP
jgi:hypothetical protein